MKICIFTSVYFNNIGNGFIDLGAEQTVKEAASRDTEIVKLSQCANFAASLGQTFALKENPVVNWAWTHLMQRFASQLHDKTYEAVSTLDVFSPARLFQYDYMIIPGCVLTVPFFTIYGNLLQKKVAEGTKLIFLGASGNYYSEHEVTVVKGYLKKIQPYAIITRDAVAYQHYGQIGDHNYNGIDNVFFVNRLGIPQLVPTEGSYCVVNLEEPRHQNIKKELIEELKNQGKRIIQTNHKPYPYSKVSRLSKQPAMMISDYPLDYLALYRNVDTVFSDRVHACIPTLSFGNKAVLYSDSPRKALFENVGIQPESGQVMSITGLKEKQEAQIAFLKKILV